ncbi:hypothetical protein BGW38_003864 [Lunasporangiospora selenospora]|uniref:Uncharacterized protein n=1 Tax=Lunasporangiospora selenospora TaxID=979761 RepID=A0A9P6FR99_9FUNG|nr:hypothetical protein BGW38_003864 [Lunasporangiospora selenospora]
MLAKAICLSIQTVAVILSLRPPKSSSTKEKADKVKDEGILYHLMIKLMIDCGPPALLASTALYIILMIQGVISDELKAWQVYATILSVFGYLLRAWAFRTLGRFFTVSE